MGWCSGSDIAEVVIKNFPHSAGGERIPSEIRQDFFRKFLDIMTDHDWDCDQEVLGLDSDFDAIWMEENREYVLDSIKDDPEEQVPYWTKMGFKWKE